MVAYSLERRRLAVLPAVLDKARKAELRFTRRANDPGADEDERAECLSKAAKWKAKADAADEALRKALENRRRRESRWDAADNKPRCEGPTRRAQMKSLMEDWD